MQRLGMEQGAAGGGGGGGASSGSGGGGDDNNGDDSDDPFADMEAMLDGGDSENEAAANEPELDVDDDFAALAAMLG